MTNVDFDAIVKAGQGKGAEGVRRMVDRALKECPARVGEALTAAGGLQGANVVEEALSSARGCVRDLAKRAEAQGLDAIMSELESSLAAMWALEHAGAFRLTDVDPPPVNSIVDIYPPAMKKIAPPPPKKQKLDAPRRKILPLSAEGVRRALDVAMMLTGLYELGDWTSLPDKERTNRELFFDDWRRMIFESGNISWDQFKQLAAAPAPESAVAKLATAFSRPTMVEVLRLTAERRRDNITTLPNVSVLACAQCGGNQGRERARCSKCAGMFCAKCRARTADLCLADYAGERYSTIATDLRTRLTAEARELCTKLRIDEHTRNERFVKALGDKGIDVVFADSAPLEGQESEGEHGRRRLVVQNRENTSTRKIFFAALARTHFKGAEIDATPQLESLFVDACLGVPIETGLQWLQARPR